MMIKVSKIEPLGGFCLGFRFSDGSAGEYDLSAVVGETGPMVELLRDPAYFARVFLEHGAPTWPNGFDLAPAWLYRRIEEIGALKRAISAA